MTNDMTDPHTLCECQGAQCLRHSHKVAAQPGAASAAIYGTDQYDIHNRSSEILVS